MSHTYLFRLMYDIFWGFVFSVIYLALTASAVWLYEPLQFQKYLIAFSSSFNCLVSGGLIVGTWFFVFFTQSRIPSFIEASFDRAALQNTRFGDERARYLSPRKSMTFSTLFISIGFLIFYFARFPLHGLARNCLIAFSCLEYGLMVYVGRKLYCIARMLHTLLDMRIDHDALRQAPVNNIIVYVNILSTLTVMFVYAHVRSYMSGPFEFDSEIGVAVRTFLLLPVVIAAPVVVIFNFYPRMVLRRLYARAIEDEVSRLVKNMRNDHLSEFEKKSYAIEYDKLERDELRHFLRLSLSDLPMGVTIVITIIGLIVKA